MASGSLTQQLSITESARTDNVIRLHNLRDIESDHDAADASEVLGDRHLNETLQEEAPPNGGYGWIVTACAFLVNAHTWGVNSAWAIFLSHYLEDSIFPGATHLEYALIGGLSISQAFVISPLINYSVKTIGTQPTMCLGSIIASVALLGASFATEIWHLFLTQGIVFGWGMGLLYVPASTIVPQWFSTRRSLASALASAGAGIGGLIYSLATEKAIVTLGLDWAYRVLAAAALLANLTASLLMKDRNKHVNPSQKLFNYKEYARMEVVLVIIWGGLAEIGYVTLLYSLPNYAVSIGLSQHQASVVGGMLNLGLGAGRPIIGLVSDKLGRINVSTLVTLACAIFCVTIWIPASSYGPLILFAITSGVCCGIFWCTASPVLAEVVGLQRLPSAFGVICFALVFPTTFGEPIALSLASATGYRSTQIFVGAMFFLSAASSWFLRSWKISDIEKKARLIHLREDFNGNDRNDCVGSNFWLTPRRLFMVKKV